MRPPEPQLHQSAKHVVALAVDPENDDHPLLAVHENCPLVRGGVEPPSNAGGAVWRRRCSHRVKASDHTGTFAGLVPVRAVDGRTIGEPGPLVRPVTRRLAALYKELARRSLTPIRAEAA